MSRWAPGSTALEQVGNPPPNGVGAIRVVALWPMRVRELVTTVEAPVQLSYKLLTGVPVRDYVGKTVLTEVGSDTDIVWTVSFTSRITGMRFAIGRIVRALATGLARQAEQVARETTDTDPSQ